VIEFLFKLIYKLTRLNIDKFISRRPGQVSLNGALFYDKSGLTDKTHDNAEV
jgi:hypothetical protein